MVTSVSFSTPVYRSLDSNYLPEQVAFGCFNLSEFIFSNPLNSEKVHLVRSWTIRKQSCNRLDKIKFVIFYSSVVGLPILLTLFVSRKVFRAICKKHQIDGGNFYIIKKLSNTFNKISYSKTCAIWFSFLILMKIVSRFDLNATIIANQTHLLNQKKRDLEHQKTLPSPSQRREIQRLQTEARTARSRADRLQQQIARLESQKGATTSEVQRLRLYLRTEKSIVQRLRTESVMLNSKIISLNARITLLQAQLATQKAASSYCGASSSSSAAGSPETALAWANYTKEERSNATIRLLKSLIGNKRWTKLEEFIKKHITGDSQKIFLEAVATLRTGAKPVFSKTKLKRLHPDRYPTTLHTIIAHSLAEILFKQSIPAEKHIKGSYDGIRRRRSYKELEDLVAKLPEESRLRTILSTGIRVVIKSGNKLGLSPEDQKILGLQPGKVVGLGDEDKLMLKHLAKDILANAVAKHAAP